MRLAFDTTLRRQGGAALLAGLLSGMPLAIEIGRAHWGMTTIQRPDRIVGWAGDSLYLPVGALWLAAVVAVVVFGGALWRTSRSRVAAACVVVLGAAPCASVVMQLATPDAHMYESSAPRGLAALAVTILWPVAMTLTAAVAFTLGRRIVAFLSFGAAGLSVYESIWIADIAAANGGHQPPVDSAILAQGIAAIWLVGFGVLVALAPGLRPDPLAGRGRAAGTLGSLAYAVAAIALAASLVPRTTPLLPALAAQLSGATKVETIAVAGVERTYRVHVPPKRDHSAPLLVVLHPVFGSGFEAEQGMGFNPVADARGWIVAYPDGVLDGWDGYGSNGYWGRHPGADDVAFLSAMADRIARDYATDPFRLYVTGFSRGAIMTYLAGCELPGVAAIAPISGNMATESGSADVPCRPSQPVSVLAIHGTGDGVIPFAGGHVDVNYSPFADVVARWRTIDACTTSPTTTASGRDTLTTWQCAVGSAVETWVVDGGGHGIPPGAAERIADFFAAHPLALRL